MDWPPPAEDIPSLPLEVLGLALLKRLQRNGSREVARLHVVGINGIVTSMGADYGRSDVLGAVNEAWDWLYTNGLTVNIGPGWQGNDIEGFRIISRKGRQLLEQEDPLRLMRAESLLGRALHSRIETKARIQFAIGAYESAVLEAFKELEIRVRAAGNFPDTLVGDKLMRQAFNETGPLSDPGLNLGERRAIMDLYAGAMGAFKNPLSHRTVDFDDPTIAAEQLLFADLLHRMLDSFEMTAATSTSDGRTESSH